MDEIWKAIPSCPGYECSSLGRIRSIDRIIHYSSGKDVFTKGKLKSIRLHPSGYLQTTISYNGKNMSKFVHRVVCETFNGLPKDPLKKEVNHIDGKKKNNVPENLEWCTSKENSLHAVSLGLQKIAFGEDTSGAKLTTQEVLYMFELFKEGLTNEEVHKLFPFVSLNTVNRIRNGGRWDHLDHLRVNKTSPKYIAIDNVKEIYKMRNEGHTISDIARKFNTSRASIRNALHKEYAIKNKPYRIPESIKDNIVKDLHSKKFLQREIAEKYGVSVYTVKDIKKKLMI